MYRKKNMNWMKHWDFEILDIIFMEIAFFLSYSIRHKESLLQGEHMYTRLAIILVALDIVVVFFSQNYKHIIQRDAFTEILYTIEHVTIIQLLLLLYEYVLKESYLLSRTVFLLSWGVSIVACSFGRIIWKQIVRKILTKEKNQSNMLVISTPEHVDSCLKGVLNKKFRQFKISSISFLEDDNNAPNEVMGIKTLKGKEKLVEYIKKDVVDEVYIDTSGENYAIDDLITTFLSMGVTVHVGMGFLPDDLPNEFVENIGDQHVITTAVNAATGWQIALKRLIDITGALVGLLITGIALIFVGPAIKIASPGPIFFKQKRVGKNGRIFYMYKFRSMYLDAEERKKELMAQNEMSGLMFKMENDPRIIGSEKGPGKGIGNFIRKTSIDELPQFWNILLGDMSLVGTRPPTANEYEEYDLHHKIRLSMKPGLTGMWQVSGRSDITDFDEVVRLDTKYIENWSLLLDIKILFKTFKVVFEKEGSK